MGNGELGMGQWAWGRQCVAEVTNVVAPAVMGNREWGRLDAWALGCLDAWTLGRLKRIITNAQCPMTAGASSRQSRPTHCLPNAQCPMPNTQCPMPHAQYPISNRFLE
ncbi:hypothetical protein [Tolypothrix sp. VBCCA 56010]|uniref:hypothetical protein n=1 Tax=Tolypothrix sp. VBCCA 56010 TaxID=3137731 RepID=UPI003D7ECCF1